MTTPRKAVAPKKRVRRTQAQIEADEAALAAKRAALAEARAAKIPAPKQKPWSRTVHFLVDGYTACGKVWYYGQELTIREDTAEFKLAFDSLNNFIFSKTPEEQLAQWGEVRYAPGPWPGKGYELTPQQSTEGNIVIEPTKDELKAMEQDNKARNLV